MARRQLVGLVGGLTMTFLGGPSAAQAPAQQSTAIPAYYPAGALAAGVEGTATLDCVLNDRLQPTHCKLASESPPGQGFGAAALELAKLTPPNLKFHGPWKPPPHPMTVTFKLNPISITPNLLEPIHVIRNPDWVRVPTRGRR